VRCVAKRIQRKAQTLGLVSGVRGGQESRVKLRFHSRRHSHITGRRAGTRGVDRAAGNVRNGLTVNKVRHKLTVGGRNIARTERAAARSTGCSPDTLIRQNEPR